MGAREELDSFLESRGMDAWDRRVALGLADDYLKERVAQSQDPKFWEPLGYTQSTLNMYLIGAKAGARIILRNM